MTAVLLVIKQDWTKPPYIFLKRIMSDSLEEYDRKVSIGGIKFTKLWVDDDIDALAEEEQG